MTSKYRRLYHLFFLLSIVATFGPCCFGVLMGFLNGSVVSKVSLGICGVTCLIIAAIAALNKYRPRCIPWLIFIGIYVCVKDVIPIVVAVSVGIIIDEFIFTPLTKHYKKRYEMERQGDIVARRISGS